MKDSLMSMLMIILLITSVVAAYPIFYSGNDKDSYIFSNNPFDFPTVTSSKSQSNDIGFENGYNHFDTISIDPSDGLSDEELSRYVSRSHARVEYIRNVEFNNLIPVKIITSTEFLNQEKPVQSSDSIDETVPHGSNHSAWNDQVWEALFIVGETETSESVISQTSAQSTAGVYMPSNGEIVIVSESDTILVISENTLLHELTHALQDQEGHLTTIHEIPQPTQDLQLSVSGLIEGEAAYVEWYYRKICDGSISARDLSILHELVWEDWECIPTPNIPKSSAESSSSSDPNLGVLLILFHPYSDGLSYIHYLKSQNNWTAINNKYSSPPVSTEQIIHLSDEQPVQLDISISPTKYWKPFSNHGIDGADTVGEASIFSMFWYQSYTYGANAIDDQLFWEGRVSSNIHGELSPKTIFNYTSIPSTGWGNDKLLPLYNDSNDVTEYGYIWATKWDTTNDAKEFHDSYLKILEAHKAIKIGQSIDGKTTLFIISNGPFEDAFAISFKGKTVTIVNAPTTEDIENIIGSFHLSL